MASAPRLTTVMGVARALLETVSVDAAVEVLIAEFGWDATFQALALSRGESAAEAFGRTWEHLVTSDLTIDLNSISRRNPTWP